MSKILRKPPQTVKAQEVALMLSLGRRTSSENEAYRENQATVIKFYWNYLFDEAASSYLESAVANSALCALSELLRVAHIDVILEYF